MAARERFDTIAIKMAKAKKQHSSALAACRLSDHQKERWYLAAIVAKREMDKLEPELQTALQDMLDEMGEEL